MLIKDYVIKIQAFNVCQSVETKAMTESDREIIASKHEILVADLIKSGELLDGVGLDYA